jgi:peptide chain release factor 1
MINLGPFKQEYDEILNKLSDPEIFSNWERGEELLKRKKYLEKIFEKEKELQELKNKIEENKAIISAEEDPELISLAQAESTQLHEKEEILKEELAQLVAEDKTSSESKSIIMEIRAGVGGEEAALFSSDLFRMYSKYAETQGWKQKVLDLKPTELDGLKEVIFEISGEDVFSKMKQEAGVHRVQRVPKTEKSGRIHTSTATVAVLPKPKKGKISLNPNDLKIDTFKASGHGGQYVNKRMTAVRITHLPTGLVVTSQTERSLQQNKENALSILEARLLEREEKTQEEKVLGKRRTQIGKAKRVEKIRTYNFPQDRVTDHRIKKSFHNIEEIMKGKLDPIISALSS